MWYKSMKECLLKYELQVKTSQVDKERMSYWS